MRIHQSGQPNQKRSIITLLIGFWRLLFQLLLYGSFLFGVLNWQRVLVYVRLAPPSSLFRQVGWLLVAFVVVLLLTAVIHEIGHLIAGQLASLHFHLLIIGPMQVMKVNGRYHFSWQGGLGLFNGLVSSIPHELNNLRQRMMIFALGGPLASLFLAIAAFSVAIRGQSRFLTEAIWVWEVALFVTAVSFLFFLTSMKPGAYQNGHLTDGGRIALLLHNGKRADRWCALVALNAADIRGIRPKDWDVHLIQQASSINDHSPDGLTAVTMSYQWALDSGNMSQAETQLNVALENQFGRRNNAYIGLILEKAYFLAWVQKDAGAAQDWMGQIKRNGRLSSPLFYRATAAIYLIEGNRQAALNAAQLGLQQLNHPHLKGTAQAEQEWLQKITKSAQLI